MNTKRAYRCVMWPCLATMFLAVTQSARGEGKKLLLFAHDNTFLPSIEKTLRNLSDQETKEPIFSKITNLNKWSINRLELGHLDDLVRSYESSPGLRRKADFAREADSSFRQLIYESDTYIRVDVLPKQHLLEFQLMITDSLPHVGVNEFPVIITDKSRYEGFVVDISQEDYDHQLEVSLKRLFPRSNVPPVAVVKVNGDSNEDGYYYFGVGQSAALDGSESRDADTPPEDLRFSWRQRNPRGELAPLPDSEILLPSPAFSKEIVLSFEKTGEYHFGLTVSDDIANSREKIVKLKVIQPPHLSSDSLHALKSHGTCEEVFRVPFSVSVQQGDSAAITLLPSSVRRTGQRLPQWIIGESETWPLDTSRCRVHHLFDTVREDGRTEQYELIVRRHSTSYDYRYEFHLAAKGRKGVTDTVDIAVDYGGRDATAVLHFARFFFWDPKDGATVEKRVFALRYGVKTRVCKDYYLEIGSIKTLWEEHLDDSLDVFADPYMYVSLGHRSVSIPFYVGNKRCGVGADFSVGPVSLGVARYGRGRYSIDASAVCELSLDTWAVLFFTWFFVGLASL